MELTVLKRLVEELKNIARELRRIHYGYPFGEVFCFREGRAVDVFGHVIKRAGLADKLALTNYMVPEFLMCEVLQVESVPGNVREALNSLSYSGDNDERLPTYLRRRRTAAAAEYLADVLFYLAASPEPDSL
jgi:hypothetical protein